MKQTVEELAKYVGGTVYGNKDTVIEDVRSAESAGSMHVTFARGIYAEHIEEMQAGAILVDELPKQYTKTLIVCADCRREFGRLIDLFHPEIHFPSGIHPTAVIAESAKIGKDVCIMAYTVVEENAEIGDGTVIYPNCYIGHNAKIGKNCELNPGAVVHENSVLGDRVVLRAHAVIGGQGFGFSTDENGHHTHIRQLGNAILEDDVEIGAGSAVDNGAMNSTIVRRGTKIDNLVHLGHNVEIGTDCFVIAQTGIAGSSKVGNHCILAGQTGITGHIEICDNVTIGGKGGVLGNITEPGTYVGYPIRKRLEWARIEALLGRLPDLIKTVKKLEKQIGNKD